MSTGKYEANTSRLRQGAQEIGYLPELSARIADNFLATQALYDEAYGYDDEFHNQNKPKYRENNDMLLALIREMGGAFSALKLATLGNGLSIEGTNQDAVDAIHTQYSKLDDGGGKH